VLDGLDVPLQLLRGVLAGLQEAHPRFLSLGGTHLPASTLLTGTVCIRARDTVDQSCHDCHRPPGLYHSPGMGCSGVLRISFPPADGSTSEGFFDATKRRL